MRIDELDEWQGLTPDMVREWLRKRGWSLRGPHRCWEKGRHNFADSLIAGNGEDLAFVIHCEEIAAGLTRQEALRQINPRMRKGMPSEAARLAHGETKDWLCMGYVLQAVRFCWSVNDHVQMVAGTDVFSTERSDDAAMIEHCTFWPCDRHGNKVPWPTDAKGEML